jgi:hypothetical protein
MDTKSSSTNSKSQRCQHVLYVKCRTILNKGTNSLDGVRNVMASIDCERQLSRKVVEEVGFAVIYARRHRKKERLRSTTQCRSADEGVIGRHCSKNRWREDTQRSRLELRIRRKCNAIQYDKNIIRKSSRKHILSRLTTTRRKTRRIFHLGPLPRRRQSDPS